VKEQTDSIRDRSLLPLPFKQLLRHRIKNQTGSRVKGPCFNQVNRDMNNYLRELKLHYN